MILDDMPAKLNAILPAIEAKIVKEAKAYSLRVSFSLPVLIYSTIAKISVFLLLLHLSNRGRGPVRLAQIRRNWRQCDGQRCEASSSHT